MILFTGNDKQINMLWICVLSIYRITSWLGKCSIIDRKFLQEKKIFIWGTASNMGEESKYREEKYLYYLGNIKSYAVYVCSSTHNDSIVKWWTIASINRQIM